MLFDLLFSKKCALCQQDNIDNNLCFDCVSNLKFLNMGCLKCQQPMSFIADDIRICEKCVHDESKNFYNEMICPFIYNDFLKKYVVNFKNNEFYYLADFFSRAILRVIKDLVDKNTIFVPVPLYDKKIYQRGFNQSFLIASSLANLFNLPVIDDLIIRTRNTYSQANKSFEQRQNNVKGAFCFNEKYVSYVKGKKLFIVDDIITTGATIFECAKIFQPIFTPALDVFNKKDGDVFSWSPVNLVAVARRIKA